MQGSQSHERRWSVVAIVVLCIFLAIALLLALKWKISVVALLYYIEKNQYRFPSDKDLKECTGFVVANMVKDLSRK